MSSGSGAGSDPHLLSLLRAIRLRQNAPDAAAAGEADTAAALSEIAATEKETEETQAAEPRPGAGLLWRGDPGAILGRSGMTTGPAAGSPPAPSARGAVPPAAGSPPAPSARGAIPPIGGINPSGPATPVPHIPPIAAARPIGAPGTEFPPAQAYPAIPRRFPGRTLPGAGSGPGRDGMDPADDAALRDTQRLLSTSLTFAGGPDEVAGRLWDALHQAQPALLDSLPGAPDAQRAQLARALTWLIHTMDDPPALVTGCSAVGAALAECGIQWNQLHLVGAAVAESMRTGMAPGTWRQDFDQAWRWTWQHTYEWIVHGGTLTAYQPTVWDTEVVDHDLRRDDLAVVRLRPFLPMPYRPGQYARFEVPGVPGVWRPYSLAGAPHRDDVIELHVRAKTETGVSGTLVYHTRLGDRIRVTRAEGEMALPAEPGRGVLMIAGDTGVAPMKAMLAELAATADTRQAVLFWGVRDLTELYDIEALTALAAEIPRATVIPVVAEGDPGPYLSGLVTDAVAAYGEWTRHEVYLAGPPLMIAGTSAALQQLGVPPARIHHDPPE